MECIERMGQKTDFSPWRLGDRRTHDGGEGEDPHGGGGHWGATLLTLGRSGHRRRKFWSGGHRLG
jgi:MYXO-CTERM domain-containing protein